MQTRRGSHLSRRRSLLPVQPTGIRSRGALVPGPGSGSGTASCPQSVSCVMGGRHTCVSVVQRLPKRIQNGFPNIQTLRVLRQVLVHGLSVGERKPRLAGFARAWPLGHGVDGATRCGPTLVFSCGTQKQKKRQWASLVFMLRPRGEREREQGYLYTMQPTDRAGRLRPARATLAYERQRLGGQGLR